MTFNNDLHSNKTPCLEDIGHFWSLYAGARVSTSINSVLGANKRAETQLQ